MSYTKNTWTSGDIITKVKLDNIEDGIYNNQIVYVTYNTETHKYDHSWNQLKDLVEAGALVLSWYHSGNRYSIYYLMQLYEADGTYYAYYHNVDENGSPQDSTSSAASADELMG